jgi:hypothetical protein
MNITKQVTRTLGLAAAAAVTVGVASAVATAAHASPVPPVANTALRGTWVNTNSSTKSVEQIIVTPIRGGNVSVDAFGACTPTWCEWGSVPAIVYGPSVTAKTGTSFQTDQRFVVNGKEWSRTNLQGTVARTAAGLRLTVRELTVFEDGSGRKNYTNTETFKLGAARKPTRTGLSAAGYPLGNPPLLVAGALGSWTNLHPSGGLVKVTIGGTQTSPTVEAFGQCSPTPCDWGTVRSISYGSSVSSTVGTTALAPYSFGFKNAQLVIRYWLTATGDERLTVTTYNEFTDGSGRSNYVKTETFARS